MKKSLFIYYVLLLGLLSTWNSPVLPPMILRLVFLFISIFPVIFSNIKLFPCVLSTFVIISANRHVPSYMPFLPMYLAIATILVMVFRRYKANMTAPMPLKIFLLLTFLVNFLRSMSVESVSITALVVVLFYSFIDSDLRSRSSEISISLMIISFYLCLETLIFKGESTYLLTVDNIDFERVGWNDPNYFSSIVGMGAIAALNMLISPVPLNKIYRTLLTCIIMIVTIVSLMVASRGAILAMFISSIVLLISARRQSKKLMGLILSLIIFNVLLFQMGSFDFLLSRFASDGGDIGGRSIIWQSKLEDFSAQASFTDWLIGVGHESGLALSSYVGDRAYIGFHNDYIAMLVSYGIIGLVVMLAMYLYPIFKYKDPRVTASCLYVMIISFSLEPLYSGGFAIFYFYFYICVLGEVTRQERLSENIKINTLSK